MNFKRGARKLTVLFNSDYCFEAHVKKSGQYCFIQLKKLCYLFLFQQPQPSCQCSLLPIQKILHCLLHTSWQKLSLLVQKSAAITYYWNKIGAYNPSAGCLSN